MKGTLYLPKDYRDAFSKVKLAAGILMKEESVVMLSGMLGVF